MFPICGSCEYINRTSRAALPHIAVADEQVCQVAVGQTCCYMKPRSVEAVELFGQQKFGPGPHKFGLIYGVADDRNEVCCLPPSGLRACLPIDFSVFILVQQVPLVE